MVINKKSTYEFYEMGGARVRTPPFTWPVYEVKIVKLADYIHDCVPDPDALYANESFTDALSHMESAKVIIPIKQTAEYMPLKKSPNLAAGFAQMNNIVKNTDTRVQYQVNGNRYITDKDIELWIKKFGMLCDNPMPFSTDQPKTRSQASTDWHELSLGEMLPWYCYAERKLLEYSRPQKYVMFRDTFLTLQELASVLFQAINSFISNDLQSSAKALDELMPIHLGELSFYSFKANEENETEIKQKLADAVSIILSSLLTGITMNLNVERNLENESYIFVQSWNIDSLWSAMILQFYHYLALNQPFKQCPDCGNFFSLAGSRKDRKYCPPGKTTSCSQHAKEVRRQNR